MKAFIKNILRFLGYEIRKVTVKPGVLKPDRRPVGKMETLLEDLKSRGLKCKAILDVGANSTVWSRMAQPVFPEAYFYMIEPQIEMKEKLESFCKEFNNSSYFMAGAGARSELMTLTIWDDLQGSSFLPLKNENLKDKGKQREIEIITIDSLITSSKIKIPELIKLDIQGFELEALKGAEKTFGLTEVFILEVSLFSFENQMPIFYEVIDFMKQRGYVVYDFPSFLRRPLDGALGQCDVCFVKENGFLRMSNNWHK